MELASSTESSEEEEFSEFDDKYSGDGYLFLLFFLLCLSAFSAAAVREGSDYRHCGCYRRCW